MEELKKKEMQQKKKTPISTTMSSNESMETLLENEEKIETNKDD